MKMHAILVYVTIYGLSVAQCLLGYSYYMTTALKYSALHYGGIGRVITVLWSGWVMPSTLPCISIFILWVQIISSGLRYRRPLGGHFRDKRKFWHYYYRMTWYKFLSYQQKSAKVKIMAWLPIYPKPLSKPRMTQFADAYMSPPPRNN